MKGSLGFLIILFVSSMNVSAVAQERNWSDVWKELESISYQQHDIFESESDRESFWQGVQYAEVEESVELDLSRSIR